MLINQYFSTETEFLLHQRCFLLSETELGDDCQNTDAKQAPNVFVGGIGNTVEAIGIFDESLVGILIKAKRTNGYPFRLTQRNMHSSASERFASHNNFEIENS